MCVLRVRVHDGYERREKKESGKRWNWVGKEREGVEKERGGVEGTWLSCVDERLSGKDARER